jgi:mRNA-degrading endonuclease RelE of RelBE toxin-antitoxin system
MSWIFEFAEDAEKDLRELPVEIQRRVARTLQQMAVDPFQANVKALHGPEWKGVFRRRIGSYRILFTPDHTKKIVTIARILLRSGRTYR